MAGLKVSLITTVLNEEKSIEKFVNSVFKQIRFPDEIVIVDGGSSDQTIAQIRNSKPETRNKKIDFQIIIKKGNRSVGRNEAIKNASGDIIACTDIGCILDKNWIKKITEPFKDPKTDVVAGYYRGSAKNVFQKCLIPYVLVMEDKVDPKNFLPASRSMAFRKAIWEKIGGFPEQLSHNEDYAFAKKLKEINARIVFERDAIVYWIPVENLKDAFIMFFRFAFGDAEAGIWRPKVIFLFLRYIFGILLFFFAVFSHFLILINFCLLLIALYCFWSIQKNYRYIRDVRGFMVLPFLQFLSDFAVLAGTGVGFLKKKNV